jgi:hypothetical protein
MRNWTSSPLAGFERAHDGRGDLGIGPLGGARQPDFDLVDHGLHAVDGLLGGPALVVRVDSSH